MQAGKKLILSVLPKPVKVGVRNWWIDRKYRKWTEAGKPVPPPHEVKQVLIRDTQRRSGYAVLIETGTHRGAMVEAQKYHFPRVFSIELSDHFYSQAVQRFKSDPQVTIVHGDSGKLLPTVLSKVNESAIFWLDGHYSSGDTAKGTLECPIYEELSSILDEKGRAHIILIDDARCFQGGNDYPTIADLESFIHARDPRYRLMVEGDVIFVEQEK